MPLFDEKTNIWVPRSYEDKRAAAVSVAVREYDPNLGFGRNERTGQWCIFLKAGTSAVTVGGDLPIMGFNDIPHPDDALRRIHQADAVRTGREIMQSIERHNNDIQKKKDEVARLAVEESAEAFDWGFRQMGKAPYVKSLRPTKEVGY